MKSDRNYANGVYNHALKIWDKHVPQNLASVPMMKNFCEELWKLPVDNKWATIYWTGCNAYNTTYLGVNLEDFMDCWVEWDVLAIRDIQK